uniref:hypothetical protein n=1 Tax=Flavobacterium sp. TaxID=239 RepID=UPI0040483FBD
QNKFFHFLFCYYFFYLYHFLFYCVFTVKKVKDARKSAGWALLLIAILYTTAPAVSVFAKTNLIETVSGICS